MIKCLLCIQTVLRNHFCIYFALISLNNDFITHSECFYIFNFKNNKILKKTNKEKTQKTPNKQTNPPFNKERSFF